MDVPKHTPQATAASNPHATLAAPKPLSPRDGWKPEVPKVTDDDEPSPWSKDLEDEDPPW